MSCFYPLTAYRGDDGVVTFVERKFHGSIQTLSLPCGQCVGCRLERSRQWAVRCVHEASMHEANCFLTLTYDDGSLPVSGSLVYDDFQRFMKRLRKFFSDLRIRFFMCGEYGELNGRPHYHALLFGVRFADAVLFRKCGSGFNVYTSAVLDRLWGKGFCSIGEVTFESAAYVARYVMKKITGELAEAHYGGRVAEFCHMSVKPGVGSAWYDKFSPDVFPGDYVIINGKKIRPPRFYSKRFAKEDDDGFAMVAFARDKAARANFGENSEERLATKEQVVRARLKFFQRNV